MTISLRPWRPGDYAACEALVNQAWNFDAVFAPPALAAATKRMYTEGSVLGSNHSTVAELDFGSSPSSIRPCTPWSLPEDRPA